MTFTVAFPVPSGGCGKANKFVYAAGATAAATYIDHNIT